MKRSKIYLVLSLISVIVALYFLYIKQIDYVYITAVLFIIFISLFIKNIDMEKSPFESTLKKILKTYDSILVEVDCLPKLSDKKIIKTKSFKDIVNVQFEVRKPVYYLKDEKYCDFIIVSKEDAYIYTLKDSDEIKSIVEEYLLEKYNKEKELDEEFNFINSLDDTTIVKLDNENEYKISPVKENIVEKNVESIVESTESEDISIDDLDRRIAEIRKQLEKINLINNDKNDN